MPSGRFVSVVRQTYLLQNTRNTWIPKLGCRSATTTKHGIVLSEPQKTSFGLLKVILTVVPGLLIGAGISKNIANFLEENDLFVPSDDDDDDD